MKRAATLLLAGSLTLAAGCKDYLDVNTNPNVPTSVSPNLYLPAMEHWMVTSPQYDGVYTGMYTQEWAYVGSTTVLRSWQRMGYDAASDAGAEQWRDVYWNLGQNLIDMMTKAQAQQRWDILGVGYVLKAWGWQVLTDMHGELPIKEAFDPTRFAFDYDTQQFAYSEVRRNLDSAIVYLQRSDGAVDPSYLAVGDIIYKGDRSKWLKYAYGIYARNLNHYSNKSTYSPDSVIAMVDKSLSSEADDPLETYTASSGGFEDYNFLGPSRNNMTNYRQTQFVLNLMNGTDFGGTVDPRMTRMLSPSPDGQYRGLDINQPGYGPWNPAANASQRPNNFFGYPGTTRQEPGRYIFDDKAKLPAMTYAELQFIKAEAAWIKGDKATALAAYRNGISAHIDFVNARNSDNGQTPTQISASEKAAFLADPNIVPSASALTLTQIMSQKYIALWGWNSDEIWMDMRRYHYTDLDKSTGQQVYPTFAPPTNLWPDNNGKLVYRMRPRYNSEYVWNIPALQAIGGLALDYHTKEEWITTSQP